MKSSLRKLRDFTLHKRGARGKRPAAAQDARRRQGAVSETLTPNTQIVESGKYYGATDEQPALHAHHRPRGDGIETLLPSMKVLTQMQEQYDGLLAAAQSISGSAFDFARSIHEMASYIVETFGKSGNGDIGSSLSMLAKVQYEISKLLRHYAAHVSQTIIEPTEDLLKQLESVEEIRGQYQKKRDLYANLYDQMESQKMKGRYKKGDVSDQQLSTLKEELNEQATHFDFCFQSLKQGQERSLMMQATRHHKAQVRLFAKGLNSLNAVESMIKQLSIEFHIDDILSDGETELQSDEDHDKPGIYFVKNHKKDVSILGSPSSSQPVAMETKEHRAAGMLKPWENSSKSAPLHPSVYNTKVIQDIDAERLSEQATTYALPSPTGPTARSNNPAVNATIRVEQLHAAGEHPEFGRIRTGNTFEEARGMTGPLKVEAYNQSDVQPPLEQEEEAHMGKENQGLHHAWRRSPSHSYSTSFSEGLDSLSTSLGQLGFLASPPTFNYRRAMRDNDADMMVNHFVDPLYKSGPVGRSAPWGVGGPSRISPCSSPPLSHLSPPLISELHKLPEPPSPPPPSKLEPGIPHSAPLGKKPVRKLMTVAPTLSSSTSSVKKSRSIPSSVNFAQNLNHGNIIKSEDSPVVESP